MVRAEVMASKRGQLQRDELSVDLDYSDNADRDEMIQWLQRTLQQLPCNRDPMPQCLYDFIEMSKVKQPHLIDWLRPYNGRPYPAQHWYNTFQHVAISNQHSPSLLWVPYHQGTKMYTLYSHTHYYRKPSLLLTSQ